MRGNIQKSRWGKSIGDTILEEEVDIGYIL